MYRDHNITYDSTDDEREMCFLNWVASDARSLLMWLSPVGESIFNQTKCALGTKCWCDTYQLFVFELMIISQFNRYKIMT